MAIQSTVPNLHRCPIDFSYSPWKLGKLESVVHAIPGSGVITSAIGWMYRADQIGEITLSMLPKATPVTTDSDPLLAHREIVQEGEIQEKQEKREALRAEIRNCKLLFLANFTFTLGVTALCYGLKSYDVI